MMNFTEPPNIDSNLMKKKKSDHIKRNILYYFYDCRECGYVIPVPKSYFDVIKGDITGLVLTCPVCKTQTGAKAPNQ